MQTQSDFRRQVEAQRPYLLRYASLQLRNSATAEDAVQDALLAALAGEAGFAGQSSLRTWLTGILKHKIVDAIRKSAREVALGVEDGDGEAEIEALFEANGHWREAPPAWERPDEALENAEFMRALERCLAKMPARTSRIFMMREHLGVETADICKELGITATHCWVLLHRARMSLRQCLEKNWFGAQRKK